MRCSLKQFFRTAVSGSALSQPDSLCVSLPLRDVYRISPLSVSLPSLRPSFTGFLLSAPSNSLSLHMSATKRQRGGGGLYSPYVQAGKPLLNPNQISDHQICLAPLHTFTSLMRIHFGKKLVEIQTSFSLLICFKQLH